MKSKTNQLHPSLNLLIKRLPWKFLVKLTLLKVKALCHTFQLKPLNPIVQVVLSQYTFLTDKKTERRQIVRIAELNYILWRLLWITSSKVVETNQMLKLKLFCNATSVFLFLRAITYGDIYHSKEKSSTVCHLGLSLFSSAVFVSSIPEILFPVATNMKNSHRFLGCVSLALGSFVFNW